jgi:hypothetical protein
MALGQAKVLREWFHTVPASVRTNPVALAPAARHTATPSNTSFESLIYAKSRMKVKRVPIKLQPANGVGCAGSFGQPLSGSYLGRNLIAIQALGRNRDIHRLTVRTRSASPGPSLGYALTTPTTAPPATASPSRKLQGAKLGSLC